MSTPAPLQRQRMHVTVLDRCQVSPSPALGQPRSLPLTFFDLAFWGFPPVQRVFFYDHHHSAKLDVPGFLRRELPLFKASLAAALHRFYPLAGRLELGIYAAADMGAPWGRPRKVEIVSVERTGALALAEDGAGGIEVGVALPRGEMEAFRAFYSDLVAGLT